MIALVDEAIYQSGDGVYVLAGVLVRDEEKTTVRRALRRIPPGGRRRFHWHHEADRERVATLRLLADAAGLLVFRWSPAPSRAHEVIRGHLLFALAVEAAMRGAIDLVIESRQGQNDHRDRNLLSQAQRTGRLSPTLNYSHRTPLDEPLLWLPDALAGAALSQARGVGQYMAALGTVAVIDLP